MGKVISVNISREKGTKKTPVNSPWQVIKDFGLRDDAHAGFNHRQVSLLAYESILKMKRLGLKVGSGDFAENITTKGVDLLRLKIGEIIRIGEVKLKITQKGKECHSPCAIYYQAGECIMPKEGVFAEVLEGGEIKKDDKIIIEEEV